MSLPDPGQVPLAGDGITGRVPSKFRREEPEATLVPVTVVEEPAESGLAIETYDGLRVRVEAGFDPQLLARVLSILRSSC